MKISGNRVIRLLGGLLAIPVAIFLPLLFIANEFQEAESAREWGGHPLLGTVAAALVGLAFAGGVEFLAYQLLRFALRGPESR